MRRLLPLALALGGGCVLDFESVLAQRRDAGGVMDASRPDVPAPLDLPDIQKPEVAEDLPAPDLPDATDVPGRCDPTSGVRVRLAHMASGYRHVALCMRRATGAYAPVSAPTWPGQGIDEAQVSGAFPTTAEVVQQNEPWQFAVIPADASCASISAQSPPIAALSVQLDPGDRATLLFTSQVNSQGRLVGVLGVLMDKVCTDCPPNSIDIRTVHAALGAASARLEFAINYVMPGGGEGTLVNVFFAQNVGYGGTAPVGDRGFDCDSAWYFGSLLPLAYPVGLTAFEVGGDAVANSDRFNIKTALIDRTRLATVYFHGEWVSRGIRPEFVLCYDGNEDAGLTVCDRIPASPVTPFDAGEPDVVTADAPQDAAELPDAGDATELPDAAELSDAALPFDGDEFFDATSPAFDAVVDD